MADSSSNTATARDGDGDDAMADAQAQQASTSTSTSSAKPAPIATIPSLQPGPLSHSYTWASPVPANARPPPVTSEKRQPCLMGIDEAGRGPVLGPMVYAVAYAPLSYAAELRSIGFADSKALTAERRDALLRGLIQNPDNLGWAVRVLSPQDISAGMLRRHPYNLNQQALDATVTLIQNVLDSGVDLTEIYVDTLGKAETHAKNLISHFPRHQHIKWTVTSKADAIYPIVGAASIAAKVTRDRILEGWVYREPGLGKVLMLHQEKIGRGENARGSTAGLLDVGLEEEVELGEEEEEQAGAENEATEARGSPAPAPAGEGEAAMEIDLTLGSAASAGPSSGAGKRKRTASSKLLELAEVEADMALKRTLRKTAQIRAAVARQVRQLSAKEKKKKPQAAAEEEEAEMEAETLGAAADGLVQSPNPAFANVGSGYPGDPNTVAFLKATLDPVFGWPGIARFSWGTIRTMLEPPAAGKKGASSAGGGRAMAGLPTGSKGGGSGSGKGKAPASSSKSRAANPRSLRSAGGELDDLPDDAVEIVTSGGWSRPIPKHGYPVRWADEQREAAAAAVTSISKFFAPVAGGGGKKMAGNAGSAAAGAGGPAGAGGGEEGPLGRVTIARLEEQELRKARVPMWKDLGLAPVGSSAFGL
ncbi:hypothetical protein OC842_000364 [Tilletia horrida]|uniref:Ribonuclease n=1 Tax=Tilletia horrida TaxID=155126 RepID=A0AAN6GH42_9BASI|nr:hypothetical protein OC842_000364 [Tilletia horrida]